MNTIQICLIGSINHIINFKYAIITMCQKKHGPMSASFMVDKENYVLKKNMNRSKYTEQSEANENINKTF